MSTVPLPGGWIGKTTRATLTNGLDVVAKQCPFPADSEADGYAALARAVARQAIVPGDERGDQRASR